MKIAIVGAGFTGLTAGFRLSQAGHQLTFFEKESQAGGLTAGFKAKNWDWGLENYFHHLFTSDQAAKDLLTELGLVDQLFFVKPKTSIFYQNQTYQFDSPLSVLKFSPLSPDQRLRTGAVTAFLRLTNNWQSLESITADSWLRKAYGKKVYSVLWEPLLRAKFGDQYQKVNLAWFWARVKKRSPGLGYLKGGFGVLIEGLVEKIKAQGGEFHFNSQVKDLDKLRTDFDRVIVTTPTEIFFPSQLPPMVGTVVLTLVLEKEFLADQTYWLNINQHGYPFVAVVEHTHLVNRSHYGNDHLVYVGGYYPQTHPYFKMSKAQLLTEFLPYLKKIKPLPKIKASYLATSLWAQPVMPVNYSSWLKKLKLPDRVYLANLQTVYPWDRGVNYAIAQGEKVANEIS